MSKFSCEKCNKKYISSKSLNNHLKKYHIEKEKPDKELTINERMAEKLKEFAPDIKIYSSQEDKKKLVDAMKKNYQLTLAGVLAEEFEERFKKDFYDFNEEEKAEFARESYDIINVDKQFQKILDELVGFYYNEKGEIMLIENKKD